MGSTSDDQSVYLNILKQHGYTNEDISALLGLSAEAAESHVLSKKEEHALLLFREILKKEVPFDGIK